ncbi:RHS repeat-associated core domain-containing protein [Rhizobiales bacterium GAS191]|nr:RHS repeat-associated core domain-containing protein [Rhizobiales bacterium GAS191]
MHCHRNGRQQPDNPFQYTGRENDGTGLLNCRARYYNPAWGRFVSEDPIGLRGGINVYAYANSNPVQLRDPSGNQVAIPAGGGLGGLVLAGAIALCFAVGLCHLPPPPPKSPSGYSKSKSEPAQDPNDPATPAPKEDQSGDNAPAPAGDDGPARPDGIPDNWNVRPSKKNDGTIYSNPDNPNYDNVRVNPGIPDSSYPAQRGYVKGQYNGRYRDVDGNR